MKISKIRSLLYLCCFIIAAVVHYHMEQEENFQNPILTSQTAELQAEDLPSDTENEEFGAMQK